MSKVIPKEQLTAYQRWELASFEESDAPGGMLARHHEQRLSQDAPGGQVSLPTAEQVEHTHEQAWREGYELGLAEGRKTGFEAGAKEGQAHARRLKALADALEAGRLRQDDAVAAEILELALAIAQQMLRTALRVKPELILEAIREALISLPVLNGHHSVVTHPDCAAVVREWLAAEHGHLSWKVKEDASLDPGSFRFESAYSELDGNLEIRWREIVDCLGADSQWMS